VFSIPSILSMPRNLFFSANLVVTDDVENGKRQSKHRKCKVKFAESQSLLDDVSKIPKPSGDGHRQRPPSSGHGERGRVPSSGSGDRASRAPSTSSGGNRLSATPSDGKNRLSLNDPRRLSSIIANENLGIGDSDDVELIEKGGDDAFGPQSPTKAKQEFTERQLSGLRTAFKFFDKDTDGGINAVELDRVLGELGESTTVAECEKMIAEVDSDGNGCIDIKEFIDLLLNIIAVDDTEEEVLDSFRRFDPTESGFIDEKELRRVMTNLGDHLSESELDDMIRDCDPDGDGKINYTVFTKLMMTPMDA